MRNCNESLKQLTMERCSDPKYELVFPQLVRGLRKLLEKCFRGGVKDTFLYSGELKTVSNFTSLLSGYYRHHLKGYSASITGLRNYRST